MQDATDILTSSSACLKSSLEINAFIDGRIASFTASSGSWSKVDNIFSSFWKLENIRKESSQSHSGMGGPIAEEFF